MIAKSYKQPVSD